ARRSLGAVVEREQRSLRVGGDDAIGGGVIEPLEKLLRLAQLTLQLATLGDVAEAEDGVAVLRPQGPGGYRQRQGAPVPGLHAQVGGEHAAAARRLPPEQA